MIQRAEYLQQLKGFKDKQIIKVITGVRRAGKSTLLELYKEYLLSIGIKPRQILSINLEELEFSDLKNHMALHDYVKERLCKDAYTYVFIDEVQNCVDFQKAVDSLFVKKNVDIYITGSNAHMLSGELATLLSGRYVTIEMLPLSFKEYVLGTANDDTLEQKLRNYIRFGSFPFVIQLNNDKNLINQYLSGIYSTIFLKDIIYRNNIKDTLVLEDVLKYIMDNVGGFCTSKKISDTLTSNNRKTSQPTVENYLRALCDSYLIYQVNRYDIKGKQYLKSLAKYYTTDIGLRNFLLGYKGADSGHLLENIVYLELFRRGYELYVGKVGAQEVDFVAVKQSETLYIQVAQTVQDPEVLQRELCPLQAITDYNPRILITADHDINSSYDGIKHINIIDFLMETAALV